GPEFGRAGGAVTEFIAVGGDNERELGVDPIGENDQTHRQPGSDDGENLVARAARRLTDGFSRALCFLQGLWCGYDNMLDRNPGGEICCGVSRRADVFTGCRRMCR